MKVSGQMIVEIARAWDGMTPGERRREVTTVAATYGTTEATVYRRVKKARDDAARITTHRADRGKPRVVEDEALREYVKAVMGLKSYDPYLPENIIGDPHKTMSTARALEIAERLAWVPAGLLTPRTVNRWARRWSITPENICAPTPAVKLVSLHPNQVHVIDFSVCEQYYLRDSDGKVLTRPWTYKNKPNESRMKIWTFMLVDHYSTVKWLRYYLSAGESSRILFEGIAEAWTKKDDSQFPFHGAPKIVYADKGSALGAGMIENLLAALGVQVIKHKPGNPRAKGMVESAFRHFQRGFESELRLCPASSIEDLNARAYQWLVRHNWETATGENTSRMQKWLSIKQDELLELPSMEMLRRLTATGEIRTVDVYATVRYEGEIYGVPGELVGRKVRIWTNIDGGISVQNLETGEMHPTGDRKTAVFGEFNRHRKSEAAHMREDAIATAREMKKRITVETLSRELPNVHAMPRRGTEIEIDSALVRKAADAYDSVYQAKRAIADELKMDLGALPGWMVEEIEAALSEGLGHDRVRLIAEYVGGFVQRQAV